MFRQSTIVTECNKGISPVILGNIPFICQIQGVEHLTAEFCSCSKSCNAVPPPTDCLHLTNFIGSCKEFMNIFEFHNLAPSKPLQDICEIIGDLVHYLVPQLHTVSQYQYPATVLLYSRTCLLLVLKPLQKGFPDLLGI